MATIFNTRPLTPSKFDKFWLTSLHLIFPSDTSSGLLIAILHPYDGEYVITSQPKYITISNFSSESTDDAVHDIVKLIKNESKRMFESHTFGLHSFKVLSNDPTKATVAFFNYIEGSNKCIEDCFALATKDTQFGQNINNLLLLLAQIAKLPTIN